MSFTLEILQRDIPEALTRLAGTPIVQCEGVGAGRNSRVYKVIDDDGRVYLAKHYFAHRGDARDRLQVEFSGLQFLWNHGVREIPQPIAADWTARWALYEYVEGASVPPEIVTSQEIGMAVEFLSALKALRDQPDSRHCPVASEACFSIQAIFGQLQERIKRFPHDDGGPAHLTALHAFVREQFLPAGQTIRAWCDANAEPCGIALTRELRDEDRTLSPSDFGFHNAIRRPDGRLVFVDFEYFGWDDPAKMIVDMLLHPAMTLSDALKREFVARLLPRFDDPEALARRVRMVYPLWGLKWCLILLNEFVPLDRLRRGFAKPAAAQRQDVYRRQLAKAQQLLQRILQEYDRFPYGAC